MRFSTDVDLLKWEPVLFGELALPSQQLGAGSDGSLTGSTFTASGAHFEDWGVGAGHVLALASGSYEVVSRDSQTQLTVSVVRANSSSEVVGPPGGENLTWQIHTFDPQAEQVAEGLLEYFGLEETEAEQILNEDSLRRVSVFGVLAVVFTGSAVQKPGKDMFWQKAVHYRRLFEAARAAVRLQVDTDGDGYAEQYRQGGAVRLRRV